MVLEKKSVLLAKSTEIRILSYQVHPYGGGHRCLNLCAHVLNEGVFILSMDNHLSSGGGHQEGVIFLFVYVQDDLQPWEDKVAHCGQRLGEHTLGQPTSLTALGASQPRSRHSHKWKVDQARLEAPQREELCLPYSKIGAQKQCQSHSSAESKGYAALPKTCISTWSSEVGSSAEHPPLLWLLELAVMMWSTDGVSDHWTNFLPLLWKWKPNPVTYLPKTFSGIRLGEMPWNKIH